MHATTQARFAEALLAPAAVLPAGIHATGRRFDLYRANVLAGLTAALATRFPVSVALVGEAFFAAMTAAFVRASPPRSPVLLHYGEEMPAFVERFSAARAVPCLADMMRLELARSQAFHAADAEPASAADLAALRPDQLGETRARPHPAARLLASPHPVATIAAMHEGDAEPRPIEPWLGEELLVTRPRLKVLTHVLRPGEYAFIERLFAGQPVGIAVAAAVTAAPGFDLAAALAGLVAGGALLSFDQGPTPSRGLNP